MEFRYNLIKSQAEIANKSIGWVEKKVGFFHAIHLTSFWWKEADYTLLQLAKKQEVFFANL